MPVSVSRRSLLKASGLTAAAVSVNGAASAVASAATKDINVQHPIRNIEHIRAFYKNFPTRLAAVRKPSFTFCPAAGLCSRMHPA